MLRPIRGCTSRNLALSALEVLSNMRRSRRLEHNGLSRRNRTSRRERGESTMRRVLDAPLWGGLMPTISDPPDGSCLRHRGLAAPGVRATPRTDSFVERMNSPLPEPAMPSVPSALSFSASPLDTSPRIAKVAALDQNTAQARSSVGEHYLDTVGVGGSIPPVPTRTLQGSHPSPFARSATASARHAGRGLESQGAECYPAPSLSQLDLSFVKLAPAAAGGLCAECRTRE